MKNTTFSHVKRIISNHSVSTNSTNQKQHILRKLLANISPLIWGAIFSLSPIFITALLANVFASVDFWPCFLQSPDIIIVGITIYVSCVLSRESMESNFVLFNTLVILVGLIFYVIIHMVSYVDKFDMPTSFIMWFNPLYCLLELIICCLYTCFFKKAH